MVNCPGNPVIGLVGRWDEEKQEFTVADDYLRAVKAAGGVPALLSQGPGAWEEAVCRMDGFLLCGNASDIAPTRYGQPRHPRTETIHVKRDAADWRVLEHAFDARKPVLGICFGMQSLNVYLGGTLLQHIPEQVPGALEHESREAEHAILLDAGSRLAEWAGGIRELRVNSRHHQSPDRIGNGLRVAARAPDGVLEALEGDGADHFVIGVAWHPERIWEREALSARLFQELVSAAKKRRSDGGNVSPVGTHSMIGTAQ